MRLFLFYILFLFVSVPVLSSEPDMKEEKKSRYDLLAESKSMYSNVPNANPMNPRYVRSIIFSFIIPGAGQTYTGNELKGAAFTLSFFGTALGAILNNNNFNGREERISNLLTEYKNAGTFATANSIWSQIVDEKTNRDNDNTRRKIFTYAAIGIWLLNMADVIFYNTDAGPDEFAKADNSKFQFAIQSMDNFNGIALKYNLP
ncbi:MAG TPA: DUF5683 domain-containing protein [Ignavibacteriaceae bacterium]|nr:DUF5683 domain-containing protein [Ignavibacteriaceae bacterium]